MKRKIALALLAVILVGSLLIEALLLNMSIADPPRRTMPYVVLIVLDGARPDYLSVPGIPHVKELIRKSTQYPNAWAGILESETPSGHAALATGTEPHRNGILSFAWADGDNTSINLLSQDKIRAGVQREIMRQTRVPTIAGLVHAQDRREARWSYCTLNTPSAITTRGKHPSSAARRPSPGRSAPLPNPAANR